VYIAVLLTVLFLDVVR